MSDETESNSDFYECSLQLVPWAKGTDLLEEILIQVGSQVATLRQLHQWKRNHLLLSKPTLNTSQIFVFWVHSSIVDSVLHLTGVRGGFKVAQTNLKLPDSSTYQGKKQTPRPRRILLDIGCDDPALIKTLTQLGLEVELVWRHAADLLNYKIIEVLTPPEEWLTYLMPHRTRLFFPPPQLLKDPTVLAQTIYERTFTIRKRKRANSGQLQNDFFRTIERKSSEEIQPR